MTTLSCSSDFTQPAREIIQGKVVIYPTDTVYGLGSNPRSVIGVRKCFEIKKREEGKRMPVLVSDIEAAKRIVSFGSKSSSLADKFWPGKLTIILPVIDANLPAELTGPEKTIAVRVPNHACCRRLVSACGGSLIGTSANISGEAPLTDPLDRRLGELASLADYFVIGTCGKEAGIPSTVIDAAEEENIKVVREGALRIDEIFAHLEKTSNTDRS